MSFRSTLRVCSAGPVASLLGTLALCVISGAQADTTTLTITDTAERTGSVPVTMLFPISRSGDLVSAAPSFAAQQTFATGANPYSVTAADINGDGKTDLIVANFSGTVSVLLNTTAPGAATLRFRCC